MGDQPDRGGGERVSSPPSPLTMEQIADLRLCVSVMTPDQCREALTKLDDIQVKNTVLNRVMGFPHEDLSKKIQQDYLKLVQANNKTVISFDGHRDVVKTYLDGRQSLADFGEEDYKALGHLIKDKISPCIDSLGVYGALSDYTVTKRNGLTTLIEIGQLILDVPIFRTPGGKATFTYDCLSRSVANILHSAVNPLQRHQILAFGIEDGLKDLEKRDQEVGIFRNLSKALSYDPVSPPYAPYWLPEIKPESQPEPKKTHKKRKPGAQNAEPAKKPKSEINPQQGNATNQQIGAQSQHVLFHQQQGFLNTQQPDATQPQQQDVIRPQLSTTSTQHGPYDPNRASVYSQQSDNDSQQGFTISHLGTINSQHGFCSPHEDFAVPQEGTAAFQEGTDAFQKGISASQEGTDAAQEGNADPQQGTIILDQSNTPLEDSIDPQLWETWWSRTGQQSSEQSRDARKESFAAPYGLMDPFGTRPSTGGQSMSPFIENYKQHASSGGLGASTFTAGQNRFQSLDDYQQQVTPGPYAEEQWKRQEEDTQKSEEQRLIEQLQAATQEGQTSEQAAPSQQMEDVQDCNSVRLSPVTQGSGRRKPVRYGGTHPMNYQQNATQSASAAPAAAAPAAAAPAEKPKKPRAKRRTKKQMAEDAVAAAAAYLAANTDTQTQKRAAEASASKRNRTPDDFSDLIKDAYDEVCVNHVQKDPHMQKHIARIVARRVEGGCQMIRTRLENIGKDHNEDEFFNISQEHAVWAFLWHFEACAMDTAGTVLSSEVAHQLIADQIINNLWGCVMKTSPMIMKRLLNSVRHEGVKFEVKFDSIIQSLNNKGFTGWGRLQHVLDEMRSTAAKAGPE